MFTGIVRERGKVSSFDDGRLVVESGLEAEIGDSVSVDGICLTVVEAEDGTPVGTSVVDIARATRTTIADASVPIEA